MTRRPIITDHALLRYLERVVGIDVASRRHAVEDMVADAVDQGACALVSGGFRYILRDERVTSVVPRRSATAARMVAEKETRED